ILDEMRVLANERGIAERINYHGFKSLGPELFAYYKKADIFLIASYHEGFPRTIWEAMAHSLPVVATKVGSIPDLVQDAAALVEPRNMNQLAASIRSIIHDANLRRDLIKRGFTLASENTLEIQGAKMIDYITKWFHDNHE
ncbi:MAG: glycosyltransferase, partial [Legionellales bacterium]